MQGVSQIRAGVESDIPAIVGLLDALNRLEGYSTVTDAVMLRAALFGSAREVALQSLLVEVVEQVVGVMLYYPGYDTLSASYGYHLADMVVEKNYRRKGSGTLLMQALAKKTLAEDKQWISLTVLKQNHAAQAFYGRLGMTQVNTDFYAIGKQALAQL